MTEYSRTLDRLLLLLGMWAGLMLVASPTAQAQGLGPLQLRAGTFAAASPGERLPFWLAANQHGTVDPGGTNLGTRLSLSRPFSGDGGLEYAAEVDVLARASEHSTLTAHELYGSLRYGRVQFTAGRREQRVGRVDTSLSMGSTTWSRNAPPPFRIGISSDGYVPVPGTGGGLAVNGYLAHGWFESDRFTREALLHEKYLYLRLLPPEAPVTAYAGVAHHAMWGGTNPLRGPQEVSLRQWANVAFGLNILTRPTQTDEETSQVDANHVGMYDVGVDAELGGTEARVYRQFYIEDAPGLWLRNVWDGLWGLSVQWNESALVSRVLWEHLRMTRQGARPDLPESRGADSYYNHFKYKGGWTYQGRTLGVPLLTPASETPGLAEGLPGIGNNIVVAHHLGIEGHLGAGLSYRVLGTYSRNYGAKRVCATPVCEDTRRSFSDRLDQWSVLAEVRGTLPAVDGLSYNAAVAVDTGEFYQDRVGIRVGLTWRNVSGAGGASSSR